MSSISAYQFVSGDCPKKFIQRFTCMRNIIVVGWKRLKSGLPVRAAGDERSFAGASVWFKIEIECTVVRQIGAALILNLPKRLSLAGKQVGPCTFNICPYRINAYVKRRRQDNDALEAFFELCHV